MNYEDWVCVAMSDNSLVAEMLLRLHQAEPPPLPHHPTKSTAAPALKLEWSVRQRRSKTALPRKMGEQTRASPTTPLSWSGGTSVSGGAVDGIEETSGRVKPADNIRSKISVTSGTTPFKRLRRKKTLAELKEEESLLLKERRSLKNELASLRLVVEKQRTRNEILKKMKVDSLSHLPPKPVSASASQKVEAASESDTTASILPAAYASNKNLSASLPRGSSKREDSETKDSSFCLPDLNIPLNNDSGRPEILYGTC